VSSEKVDPWRIQVQHPLDGKWVTMQPRYRERATARSWLGFVKAAWHGSPTRTIRESKIKSEPPNG
jgi:hypothetical protein